VSVRELRVCVTAEDYEEALRFDRDVLGLREVAAFAGRGRVTILEAGPATLELLEPEHAEFVDQVEGGRRVARTPGWHSRWRTPGRLPRGSPARAHACSRSRPRLPGDPRMRASRERRAYS
jgi:catechol 2,3-dioxygenase-like lactoylglutathione lyase family enzyme